MELSELSRKVRKIEIKARRLSNDIFSGEYHSAFKGRGMSFAEVREYVLGDDIRLIDWNVTARFNHPYVKVYEEERELTLMLVVDLSGSGSFGTVNQIKRDMFAEIAGVLAFAAINNKDKVGLIMFTDRVEKYIPPKKGKQHILRIIRDLLSFSPKSNKTNISSALSFLTNTLKKKSIVVLLSDFMDKDYEQSLKVVNRKHDLIAVKIYDRREEVLSDMGLLKIMDLETKQITVVDTSDEQVRYLYNKWWTENHNYHKTLLNKYGIDNIMLKTDEDYVVPLINLFKKRGS